MTSASVIQKLKRHFATPGSPDTLISDNGGQYSGHLFAKFANDWNFKHVTSSPEYPQSNGLAENAVKQVKRLLEKSKRDGSDFYMNLLNLRNVPRDDTLGSPTQRLVSRVTRTPIPISKKLLKPTVLKTTVVSAQLHKKRFQQKANFDKHASPLKPLETTQVVRSYNYFATIGGRGVCM